MPLKTHMEVTIDLPWFAMLPRDYVPGQKLKIEVYRRLSRIRRMDRLDDFRKEVRDRFGPIPPPVEWLLRLAELRILATRWQIATLHLEGKWEGESVVRSPLPVVNDRNSATTKKSPAFLSHTQAITATGPVDLVLEYRHPRKMERLAKRAEDRLRIVDDRSAYFRLLPEEYEPTALYERIKHLLRLPERPL
jgi:transcription-repair coupling factor (superfamily II helicase)